AAVQVKDELAPGVDDRQSLRLSLAARQVEHIHSSDSRREREVQFDFLQTVSRRAGRVGQPVDHHQVDFVRVVRSVETLVQRLEPGDDHVPRLAVVPDACLVGHGPAAQVRIVAVGDPVGVAVGRVRVGDKSNRYRVGRAAGVLAPKEHYAGGVQGGKDGISNGLEPDQRLAEVTGAAVDVGFFSEQCGGVAVPAGRCEQGRGAGVVGEVGQDLGVESEGAKVVQAQFRGGGVAINRLV